LLDIHKIKIIELPLKIKTICGSSPSIKEFTEPGCMSLPAVMVVMIIVMIVWAVIAVVFHVRLLRGTLGRMGGVLSSGRINHQGLFNDFVEFPPIQPDPPALGTIIEL
jgi:hypothetical protein